MGVALGSHIVERKRVRPHDVYYLCDVCRFKESDAFVGYQKDVAAAVVFQASNQLSKWLRGGASGRRQLWESALERGLLGDHPLDQLAEEKEGSETWKNAVIGERADLVVQYSIYIHVSVFPDFCHHTVMFYAILRIVHKSHAHEYSYTSALINHWLITDHSCVHH